MCLTLILSASPTLAAPYQEQATTAQEGKKMSFQGTLYENGAPVTGERSFTFSIDLGEGNSWTETQSNVQVIEGLYAVTLGSVTPMPEDLFYGVQGRTLTVSIGNNVLGSTELLSPFMPDDISTANDLPRRIELGNDKVDSDSVFYFKITADNVTQGSQRGLQIDMTGQGFKIALRGNTLSQEGDQTSKIAIIGSATGSGSGNHEGVRGQAFGAGRNNAGVLGLAGGPGNGATGFDEGSYNTGVVGYGQNNSWGNTGVTGYAVGGAGVDNIGVAGISSVGAEGNTETENKGILGRAEGFGVNKAIWGRAQNGVENWAGWFEGDVAVRDGGNLNLYGPNEGDSLKVQLNYYEPNNSGSVLTFGHNRTRRVLLGSTSDRTGGLVHLYDSLDRAMAQLRASARAGDWVTDKQPHGQLTLWGPGGQNFYLGAKVWEENGSDAPVFQMFGKPVEAVNPDTEEVFTSTPEGIYMTVQDFGDGSQQGMLQLAKEGQNSAILNFDNLSKLIGTVDGNGKYRFEVNEQNSGILKLMSEVDSVNVLIDSNGPKAGLIHLNDSLGRPSYRMLSYASGSAYEEMSVGLPEINETRVVWQLAGYEKPWTNMIGRNPDGTALGRVQTGFLGGSDIPAFRIVDPNFRGLVNIEGNADNGGSISLEGPTTSNFWIGQKNWENSDLPYLAMRGAQGVDDGNGGSYVPDGLSLEVTTYQDGSDNGVINFSRVENGEVKTASLDYFTVEGLINPEALRVNGNDGNSYASMEVHQDGGGTQYGYLNISNSQGGGFEIGSRSWENDGNGGNRAYTAIKSTIDIDDGNGGTYRPWLVSQEFHEDGNGNQFGSVVINSTDGVGYVGLNNNNSGNIDISGSLNQSSDARLKKNVTTLTSSLAMVNRLRGVRYNWKDESRSENKIGFIAQEVEEVLPELVKTREDGFKGVNYAEMTAVLVEAVKELTAQVEALKAENNTLKAEASKVEAMEDRLAKIEALLLNNQKVNANQK